MEKLNHFKNVFIVTSGLMNILFEHKIKVNLIKPGVNKLYACAYKQMKNLYINESLPSLLDGLVVRYQTSLRARWVTWNQFTG